MQYIFLTAYLTTISGNIIREYRRFGWEWIMNRRSCDWTVASLHYCPGILLQRTRK